MHHFWHSLSASLKPLAPPWHSPEAPNRAGRLHVALIHSDRRPGIHPPWLLCHWSRWEGSPWHSSYPPHSSCLARPRGCTHSTHNTWHWWPGGLIFLGPIVLKQSKIQFLAGYHLQGTAQTADWTTLSQWPLLHDWNRKLFCLIQRSKHRESSKMRKQREICSKWEDKIRPQEEKP